jgi:hypothetical protein
LSPLERRPYGIRPGRPGLTPDVVFRTAEKLLKEGKRPTVAAVREVIGGSNSTIAPLLDEWWKELSRRFAGGPAAMDRVPASLAHVVEALYLQIRSEARIRSRQELTTASNSNEKQKIDLEVQSHVLSLREAELAERIRIHERKLMEAEAEVRALTVMLRKEQASCESAQKRLLDAQAALEVATRRRAPTIRPRRPVKAKPRSVAPLGRARVNKRARR